MEHHSRKTVKTDTKRLTKNFETSILFLKNENKIFKLSCQEPLNNIISILRLIRKTSTPGDKDYQ